MSGVLRPSLLHQRLPVRQLSRTNVLTQFNVVVRRGLRSAARPRQLDALFRSGGSWQCRDRRSSRRTGPRDPWTASQSWSPHARLLPDGTVQQIATKDIVRDEVLILTAGDEVTADAPVIGVWARGWRIPPYRRSSPRGQGRGSRGTLEVLPCHRVRPTWRGSVPGPLLASSRQTRGVVPS
jgi:hypothetical protein